MSKYDDKVNEIMTDLLADSDEGDRFPTWVKGLAIIIAELQFLREDIYDAQPKKTDW